MTLTINTSQPKTIQISLKTNNSTKASKEIPSEYSQAEQLLPLIDQLLQENNLKLADIREIEVENRGDSFTALRIGVITANALGYALGVPVRVDGDGNHGADGGFDIVEPHYNREPSIG